MPHKTLGTLVVVVLKARNLIDSHTFYKQDPYAVVRLGGTGKQTKVDKKGGQHPVWDEELHFHVYETVSGIDQRTLTVTVFSKESKVDECLGEGKVDISQTLKKGEFDDWVPLQLHGAHRGEVYLELTFYSNETPLVRRHSKLPSHDRLWRPPPPTPPKDHTSPTISPQRSPALRPSAVQSSSHLLHPSSPPHPPPKTRTPSPPSRSVSPHQHTSTPPRPSYVDPTFKNIPFLDVGPPASTTPSGTLSRTAALRPVPSILRPGNVKSSPIPVAPWGDGRQTYDEGPSMPEFQRLAQSEGVDVGSLRVEVENADAKYASRLARPGRERAPHDGEGHVPGGWLG